MHPEAMELSKELMQNEIRRHGADNDKSVISEHFPILYRNPLYQVSTNNPQLCSEALPALQSCHVLACSSIRGLSSDFGRELSSVEGVVLDMLANDLLYFASAADVRYVKLYTEPPKKTLLSRQSLLSREGILT